MCKQTMGLGTFRSRNQALLKQIVEAQCATIAQQKLGGGALTARNDLYVGFATLRFGEQALQHCFTANLQSSGFRRAHSTK